ncbi:carboxymuconolactone decarboxylase family protein [Algiphilus aromaticivorans]|uniref:carboxymuconolactone decarboxylase family protein n=1 Tax=Algiphilus aromaticivorans TaxID=382454 RepID=UPI000A00425A|nr:carboxymuconolactone decarboxylase family protein [Algiphilus aromaticivorans]
MTETSSWKPNQALNERRRSLAPDADAAFRAFSKAVFQDGALNTQTKQLIAVAVAHVTQCPTCIKGHTQAAVREGATQSQIMEAIWVAAEMRAGAAYAHAAQALEELGPEPVYDCDCEERWEDEGGALPGGGTG